MPLIRGKSPAAFSKNVSAEMNAGKPQKQAVAIAYSEKHKAEHMAEGGDVDDDQELLHGVVDEFMQAFEKRDKHALMEALTALIQHIQSEDQEQDEEIK